MNHRGRKKRPSMRAIAQEVGRSYVQVFRVLSKKKGHYSKETEQKVKAAIVKLKAEQTLKRK